MSIFIYGFPFDEGTKLNGGRIGGEKGPENFRKGLKHNKFPQFATQKNIQIIDFGNVK